MKRNHRVAAVLNDPEYEGLLFLKQDLEEQSQGMNVTEADVIRRAIFQMTQRHEMHERFRERQVAQDIEEKAERKAARLEEKHLQEGADA